MSPPVCQPWCEMCGATSDDRWFTRSSRKVVLISAPRIRDTEAQWTICDECSEGMKGVISPPSPDLIQFLSQIRRATIDDQKQVLDWLLKKFKLSAVPLE